MKTFRRIAGVGSVLTLFLSNTAMAHPGHGASGIVHPHSGVAELFALLALGIVGFFLVRRSKE